ncbi:MAG: mannitol dehydrogenase family protein, partial [Pseudomonadota bacterium]|nr:mannitol dehydrogenase family protein [Pseudomonadota bacterium]
TTAADVAQLQATTGYYDPGAVMHEPFRQWVIKDDFVNGDRPAWETAGAQLVKSVEAHELMKLRCLNGTHSTLAYLGYLAGHETIAEEIADAPFAALCQHLWRDEIQPTLTRPEGEDLPAYADALLTRYRNPAIRHRTWQIAMDGSQKLPQRLLGTIADQLARDGAIDGLALAVAGWMRYVGGVDETGKAIDVRDPLAERLRAASDSAETPAAKVAALLSMEEVFPNTLASNPTFSQAVTDAYQGLSQHGARAMVAKLTAAERTDA